MNTAQAVVKEEKKTIVKKTEKKPLKKQAAKFSFSQFKNEYDKKADRLSLSVVRIEQGKATGQKMSTTIAVRPFLAIFEKIRKIQDGKARRKEALKSVKDHVAALKTDAPRAHVLRPIIETIGENFGKDYNGLLQKSFQR